MNHILIFYMLGMVKSDISLYKNNTDGLYTIHTS